MRRLWTIGLLLIVCHARAGEPRLDKYLLPLPTNAKARLGMAADRSNASTHCSVVLAPDGKLLATAVGERIFIWDPKSGRVLQSVVAHPYKIRGIAFSDEETLLTQGHNGNFGDVVKVWNARTGKLLRSFDVPENWAGTAFAHDGKLLALTTVGDPNVLQVWDTQTGKKLYQDNEHYPFLFFAHDDRHVIACRQHRLALGKYDTIVTFREARTGKVIRRLEIKDTQATITNLSPDGKLLVGHTFVPHEMQAKWRMRLQLFDAATGKVVRTLIEQRSGDLKSALFSPDGRFVIGVNHNESCLTLWDVKTGEKLRDFSNNRNFFNYPYFARDSKTLINMTHGGRVFLHDLDDGTTRDLNPTHNSAILSLAFTPDGKRLASASHLSEIFVWDIAGAELLNRCEMTSLAPKKDENAREYAVRMAFAPDGKHLLAQQVDQTVRLFAPFRGSEIHAFRDAGHVWGFTDDGKHLLWTGVRLNLLNTFRQTPKRVVANDLDYWLGVGRWLGVSTFHPALRQFRVRAYATPDLKDEPGPNSPVLQFGLGEASGSAVTPWSLSPDGSVMGEWTMRLAGSPFTGMGTYWVRDGVRFSDSETGQEILRTKEHDLGKASYLHFAPDSRSLVGIEVIPNEAGRLKLYETRTGKMRLLLSDKMPAYGAYAFTHDGRWLAFINTTNAIEIFDLALGKRAATISQKDAVVRLAFSPDGSLLASGGSSGTIVLWDLDALLKRDINEPAWSDDDKVRLWNDLASADAEKAFAAMMRLKRRPADAAALIRAKLQWRDANKDVARLIERLGSDEFATRKKASDALEALGERARPMLVKSLPASTSLEHRRRVEMLIEKLGRPFTTPVGLRLLRSIEVLDSLRSAEAAALLREIADGAPGNDPLAREIAQALQRSTAAE